MVCSRGAVPMHHETHSLAIYTPVTPPTPTPATSTPTPNPLGCLHHHLPRHFCAEVFP
jgi:hypothetical protein